MANDKKKKKTPAAAAKTKELKSPKATTETKEVKDLSGKDGTAKRVLKIEQICKWLEKDDGQRQAKLKETQEAMANLNSQANRVLLLQFHREVMSKFLEIQTVLRQIDFDCKKFAKQEKKHRIRIKKVRKLRHVWRKRMRLPGTKPSVSNYFHLV